MDHTILRQLNNRYSRIWIIDVLQCRTDKRESVLSYFWQYNYSIKNLQTSSYFQLDIIVLLLPEKLIAISLHEKKLDHPLLYLPIPEDKEM